MDLTDIYRIFHLAAVLLNRPWNFFQNRSYFRVQASLRNVRKKETACIPSDSNGIKLELNSKRNYRKISNIWGLNNSLLNEQWVIKEIRK
jgi:hypothetical protein